MIRCYRDLEVWQKSMDLVVECYEVSERFPKAEMYDLVSQLRRAVVSIPANIAEGHGRTHTKEYLHHLSMAYGSLMEVETHLLIASRLDYLDSRLLTTILERSDRIGRMLNGLIKALSRHIRPRLVTSDPDPQAPTPDPAFQ
jgi:four helix bundle protein